jgi:hypothetical protein
MAILLLLTSPRSTSMESREGMSLAMTLHPIVICIFAMDSPIKPRECTILNTTMFTCIFATAILQLAFIKPGGAKAGIGSDLHRIAPEQRSWSANPASERRMRWGTRSGAGD